MELNYIALEQYSGYFMHHNFWHSNIRHFSHALHLCVLWAPKTSAVYFHTHI